MYDAIRSEVWQVVLPLERPIDTPLGPFSEVRNVVVRLRDAAGHEGCGYTVVFDAESSDRRTQAVRDVLAGQHGDLIRLLRIERTLDDRGDVQMRKAVAAISLAAWDLLGRQRGVACADLWGRSAQRTSVPAYGSALFLDRSWEQLVEEARALRKAGYAFVKMRGGKSPLDDAARFNAVCGIYPEQHRVAIDFVFQSTLSRVREFRRRADAEPMWIEDPTGYEVIAGFGSGDRLAAGEQCSAEDELQALRAGGIGRLILDVECLGGPLRFLEAARNLQALGCEAGAHKYAHESIHLLAALPRSMPVEMLDWWNPLFNETPAPDARGHFAVRGPGLGRTLRESTLARHGRPV
jgi:L-alanine-DL-glutamate epimerase-like enolase superfamily enzyme